MNKFLKKTVFFILLVVLLDRMIGAACEHFFFRTFDGDTGGQVNGLLRDASEVVVFGSSRAESHYVPSVLSEKTRMTVYNAGIKGSNALYDYGVQQLVFERYTPDLIVYDFYPVAIAKKTGSPFHQLESLHPYWKKPFIWELIRQKSPWERILFLSAIYPYNSKIHSIVVFNFFKSRPGVDRGYRAQYLVMDKPSLKKYEVEEIDPVLYRTFAEFIGNAQRKAVPLVVVCSPRHADSERYLPRQVRDLLKSKGVPVLDFNPGAYPAFSQAALYRDPDHLNDRGARLFSSLLGEELKKMEFGSGVPAASGGTVGDVHPVSRVLE